MEKNFTKDYIEISNEFRKSDASKESVEKLYDLLYDLQSSSRTKSDDLTLSNLYSLLGFHQSAYETFKSVTDLTDRKNTSKLYVLEEKAKSHKNDFIIKDIRKFRQQNERTKLLITDFLVSTTEENKVAIIDKDVVIFNKVVKNDKVEIFIYGEHKFENFTDKIIDYIFWLGDCKKELIEFYNKELSEDSGEEADKEWYDTLEIYRLRITVGQNGNLYAEISGGDDFSQDHILDIEIENKTITAMNYDG
ncbi:hypothetical protein ACR79M_21415 [Sphingobacterium spiritivorum]|uniref:hypothetical protein n=1 Tax=Sphingobacterium spiritivorum TaxID=258 RepID=UPI003DA40067